MRICHINEPGAGGSFGIMVALASYAVERGHEVHGIYSDDRADPTLVEHLRTSGTRVHAAVMRRAVGPWDVLDGWRLRRLLTKLGPFDIIHSHSSKAGVLARVFGYGSSRAQVYSPHGFYTMTGKAPAYVGAVERVLSGATDRIITVSEYEKDHGLEVGIAARRISVIPNGVQPSIPLPRAEARKILGLDPHGFVIGFVGRLETQKDPLSAVAVMGMLRGGDETLAMIGDGPLRIPARDAALAAGTQVKFFGARAAKPLFSAFDVLLCTSVYEGMPVAFLESLNAGVPIISFPVGGTHELIDEGRTGFVVKADPPAAADAIRLLRGLLTTDRQRIAQACRDKAAQHTDRIMGDATLALYRELLG